MNTKSLKFFGCNMYELAGVDDSTTELMLRDAKAYGFDTVRFWCFYPTTDEKLQFIINCAKKYELKLISVLADRWNYNQKFEINSDWFTGGYKKVYLPYILNLIEKFKKNEEILIWELINEPAAKKFDYIYNFVSDVTQKIKAVNTNHLISIGTIGGIGDKLGNHFSRFNSSLFEKLYSIKGLDIISIHDYSYDSTLLDRIEIHFYFKGKPHIAKIFNALNKPNVWIRSLWDYFCLENFNKIISSPLSVRWLWRHYIKKNIETANSLNKQIYIGEIGYKSYNGNFRKNLIKHDRIKYFNEGVSGYMLWSFEAQGKSIDGHGYGFGNDRK
ncbi:MAG: cellulase family glycosylhydrolase [Bacteroidetes bacterium]|nr:cellulase family glycosylhydrolase [Bacteroidota bacterium]